jgi:hypothetical protein
MRASREQLEAPRCGSSYYRSPGAPNRRRQGQRTVDRLFSIRLHAYLTMRALGRSQARLVGEVKSGRLRCDGLTILEVITDNSGQLIAHLRWIGFGFSRSPPAGLDEPRPTLRLDVASSFTDGEPRGPAPPSNRDGPYPVEIRVYPTTEAAHPALHLGWSAEELEAVLVEWHTEEWEEYQTRQRELRRHSRLVECFRL